MHSHTKLYACFYLLRECFASVRIGFPLPRLLGLFIQKKKTYNVSYGTFFSSILHYLSLCFVTNTGVRCINLVRLTRERSLLWYRRVPTLQVYAEVPVFQLERRQFILHQRQQRELSNRCRRVSIFHLSLFLIYFLFFCRLRTLWS